MDATVETFPGLVEEGVVLVDFWGPNCAPCLALMPEVEALVDRLGERVRLVKVNAPQNRQICRNLRVLGLPTYLVYRDGHEMERLTGDPSIQEVGDAVGRVLGGE